MPNLVVTIAREYGSGGRLIGEKLASELGVAFYDRKLISLAAEQSGYAEDVVRANEGVKASPFSYINVAETMDLPMPEKVFITESGIIKKLAESEPCVIIGRCADFLLKDMPGCIRVFLYAPMEYRAQFAIERYGDSKDNIEAFIRKADRTRKAYYSYYTEQEWGEPRNYHISFDSSIGVESSVELLKNFVGLYKAYI